MADESASGRSTPVRTPSRSASPNDPPTAANDNQLRTLSPDHPEEPQNERSPLLSSHSSDEIHDDGDAPEDPDYLQDTKSIWYLILLTVGIGGLQVAWSVELSNGSPYLLSLGLSKSLMALVWIAGPLTGTLVQPYVGMLSDNCRLALGKRRPFIIAGTVASILSLMLLAWVKEIVGGILSVFGADPKSEGVRITVIVAAVIGVYVLDFAINTVQAGIRAFIVDCAPSHQQEAANAMASRILGIGNIIGFIAGYVNLRNYLRFLGGSQFKVLCALASVALAATVALSTATIKERDPRQDAPPPKNQSGLFSFFVNLFKSIRRLPPQVKRVCQVQACAWVGFFPLLFYTSSYIGEIYVEPFLEQDPHMSLEKLDELYEKATRVGTFALLLNSIVSLLTNVFLPFLVSPTYDSRASTRNSSSKTSRISAALERLQIPGLTLKWAWFASLILFAVAMFLTVFVRSVAAASALIGLVGITWGMTLWAPWAIISGEISRRDALIRTRKKHASQQAQRRPSVTFALDDGVVRPGAEPEEHDQAGVILGIHNMAIAAPQMIATVASSIIFKIWQKPRGTPGDRSLAIVFALGGICVLVASFFVSRIEDGPRPADKASTDEETAERGEASHSGSDG